MVLNKVEDSMEALVDTLKDLSQRAILPDHVVALITSIVLDKMSYSFELNLAKFEEDTSAAQAAELKADLERLPSKVRMMVCPGGDRRCGADLVRSLVVSETVPGPFRGQMEAAIQAWCETMDDIARAAAGKSGVPLVVGYDLTPKGPELALAWGRESHVNHAEHLATPVAEIE